jgi:ribosomal protein L7Ae-like RNA K-turn-binding protein
LINKEKILGLLGIASKTKKIVFGKVALRNYISKKYFKNKLVIISVDCGKTVKQDIIKRCDSYNVSYIIPDFLTKEILSKTIGKENVSILGVTEDNLINGIIATVNNGGDE